ncbi:MAG: hypothetical protein ACYDCC_12480 [Actinomycetota bacterium]
MAKLSQIDITVKGDPTSARNAAVEALQSLKFRLKWEGDWNATAERGNKVLNIFLGAIAQYFKVGLKIFSTAEGQTVVQLLRESRGTMGGAIGVMRTTKNMQKLQKDLTQKFTDSGILLGVNVT